MPRPSTPSTARARVYGPPYAGVRLIWVDPALMYRAAAGLAALLATDPDAWALALAPDDDT